MYKFALACLSLISSLTFSTLTHADELAQPVIRAHFITADAAKSLPKFRQFNSQDPGYNKILLRLQNFPSDKEIVFEIKRLAGAKPEAYEQKMVFTITPDGTITTKNQEKLKYLVVSSRGFLPGERVYFRFHSADGTIDREMSGIPNPAIIRNIDGNIAMRAELLTVKPTVYAIDLPTMQEGEEYKVKSKSVGETTTAKPKYNSKIPFHYSPSGGKAKGGIGFLEIKRSSGETLAIKLPWGTDLEPYLRGNKSFAQQ